MNPKTEPALICLLVVCQAAFIDFFFSFCLTYLFQFQFFIYSYGTFIQIDLQSRRPKNKAEQSVKDSSLCFPFSAFAVYARFCARDII